MARKIRKEQSTSGAAGGYLTKNAFKDNTKMYKKAGYKNVPKIKPESFDVKVLKEIIKRYNKNEK